MTDPRHRPPFSQLELDIARVRVPDRNFKKGGRSFYFFDFDDNVMRLDTNIFVFKKGTSEELALSTRRFSEIAHLIGRAGTWKDYEIRNDDTTGSFRRFRDLPDHERNGQPQPFVEDMARTLDKGTVLWRGPSWEFFFHAVFNGRPIAIITARGHHPDTIRAGIALLRERGHVPSPPNYVGIFSVSNREVRAELGDPHGQRSTAELKKVAIIHAVLAAMETYGENPHHRFGMSDDDAANVARIIEAMTELKRRFPENAFFVFNTGSHPPVRTEVLADSVASAPVSDSGQLTLFGD